MERNYEEVALSWLTDHYDTDTREKVKYLINNDKKELEDSFYKNLEFGTGGLRGIMGVGTNRMNIYTVGMATQGFANYLNKNFKEASVVIAYDSRNNSKEFAMVTAKVFAANNMKVYIFEDIRPTPVLSYAIRNLGCKAGVMITASHNPKEYNGYKAFWEDGGQITAPHDVNIICEVNKIKSPSMVNFGDDTSDRILKVGKQIDEKYINSILSLTLSPEIIKKNKDLKMVYTPLHGTGVEIIPKVLRIMGFENLYTVESQNISDGNFPTLDSPNPEEASALELAIQLAAQEGADLVMATDPDADRVGIAVRDDNNELVLLNGNQTASILTYYILSKWQELGKLDDNKYIVKTIVTTELLSKIAEDFNVEIIDVLTGFKYIAEVVRENEGKKEFICGGEESYGFNIGEFVRDKDAVISCAMIAECAVWALEQGFTLFGLLQQIYSRYGEYREKLLSITKKGKDGAEEIQNLMKSYRENPPKEIAGSSVVKIEDYLYSDTGLPKSNVIRFFTEDESVISVRPSGTEPKIKFYFGVKGGEEKMDNLFREFSSL